MSTSRGLTNARALAFAPGAHETTAGSPHWPIDPAEICNGACILHSSGLTGSKRAFYSASTKYVVGSSKAAIDILETLDPEDESVVWANRGHIVFHNRARIHAMYRAAQPTHPRWIAQAHTGNLFLKNQEFAVAFSGMLRSGNGVCVGQPLTAHPAMRGGVETEESMA